MMRDGMHHGRIKYWLKVLARKRKLSKRSRKKEGKEQKRERGCKENKKQQEIIPPGGSGEDQLTEMMPLNPIKSRLEERIGGNENREIVCVTGWRRREEDG